MIPAGISTALTSLEDQVSAAQPLPQASHATLLALQLNAGALVETIDETLKATSLLDTWTPPPAAPDMASGFLTVLENGKDESALSLMRGVVGRVAANLDQIT